MTLRRRYLLSVSLALLSGSYALVAQTSAPGLKALDPAPNFSRLDLSHKRIELRSYRGKVVLLNFWATWCTPCLVEMPSFAKWQSLCSNDGLEVIGISMDDTKQEVAATVARLKLNYPVLMGDENLGTAYGGVLELPVTYLIDRHGKIRARYEGAADLPRIKREIDDLLKAR